MDRGCNSGTLEAGWFVGKGKPVYVLTRDGEEPELMQLDGGDERRFAVPASPPSHLGPQRLGRLELKGIDVTF